ncbi:energy transducer TonB [bacterium]|nr:energy transducer TonB [bacterium]
MHQSLQRNIYKEFSRPLFRNANWDLIWFFSTTLLFEAVFIIFMARRPVEEYSKAEIARIQEQFANFIMAEEEREAERIAEPISVPTEVGVVEEVDVAESEGEGTNAEMGADMADIEPGVQERAGDRHSAGTEEIRRQSRQANAEARRQSREAISRSVSTKGLLGLLTGSGSAAEGNAVDNVLSGSGQGYGGNHDLDQILSSVNGLQTQGGSGLGGSGGPGSDLGGVRGSRSGGPTTIDDLVSDRSDMAVSSMSRQGDLMMENPSDVIGRGSKSAYRSPNAIREVLLGHVPAIRYCYERELKRDPELKGKISVRITVSPDGHVMAAEILSSSLNNTRVQRCILARIRLWKDFKPIDPTEGSVTFRQVYTFGI